MMIAISLLAVAVLAAATVQYQLARNQQSNTYTDNFNLVISNISLALNSQQCGPILQAFALNPAATNGTDPANGLPKTVLAPGILTNAGGTAVIPSGQTIDGLQYTATFGSLNPGNPATAIGTFVYVTGEIFTQYIVSLTVSAVHATAAVQVGGNQAYSETFYIPIWVSNVNTSMIGGCNCIMGVAGC
jgi:hypothetical protein